MSPRILIIGGGVGGLSLAHGLKNNNIPFHVYERDRTENYRAQGYRFRNGPAAIEALQSLVDEQTFRDFQLSCADLRAAPIPEIDAETAKIDHPKVEAPPPPPPGFKAATVDRSSFRDVLIKNLGAEYISYDKSFDRYETTPNGVTAYFKDGSSAEGTLLVGADGSNSKVRKQLLPDLKVVETGVACLYGKTPMTDEVLSEVDPAATVSMSVIKDRGHGDDILISALDVLRFPHRAEMQRKGIALPPDYLFWVMSGTPEAMGFKTGAPITLSGQESEARALELSRNWAPSVRTIVTHQQQGETSAFSITSVTPDYPAWEPNERVTGLGDAMHKLMPTGGGALLAFKDAAALCKLLVDRGAGLEMVREYEAGMRERAVGEIAMSWNVAKMMLMKRGKEKHVGEMMMMIRGKRTGGK